MSNQLQVLIRARALLAKGWTHKVYARDSNNRIVPISSPEACKWCLDGAIKAAAEEKGGSAYDVIHMLDRQLGQSSIDWNDNPRRTQASVLRRLDRIITEMTNADQRSNTAGGNGIL